MGSREGAIKAAAAKLGISVREYTRRVAEGLKRCTICGEWLPVDQFARDRSRGDGRACRCQTCSKAIWRRKSFRSRHERADRRAGDKLQARSRINHDMKLGLRPDPNALHCALCGHKGDDRRHEYHHAMGYEPEHHYDVLPLCSTCHSKEHRNGED